MQVLYKLIDGDSDRSVTSLIPCVTHSEARSYEMESARALHLLAGCGVGCVCRCLAPEERPDRFWDLQWPDTAGDPVHGYGWKDADLSLSGSGEKLGDEKLAIIQECATNFTSMTNEKADEMAKRVTRSLLCAANTTT